MNWANCLALDPLHLWLLFLHALIVTGRPNIRNRTRLDPEWSETIEKLEIDYDEKGTVIPSPQTPVNLERSNWDFLGHLEVPYYAVLYTNITEFWTGADGVQRLVTRVRTKAGGACGGVLVNEEQVLTTCGCLYTWYRWLHIDTLSATIRDRFNAEQTIFQYTLNSEYRLANAELVPSIYIAQSVYSVYFKPDFKYKLINDRNKQKAKTLTCKHWESDVRFDEKELMYGLVLANFEPRIDYMARSAFMPWPPVPIANLSTYNRHRPLETDSRAIYPSNGIRARIVGIGFLKQDESTPIRDDDGDEVDIPNSMVDVTAEVVPITECESAIFPLAFVEPYVKNYLVCLKGLANKNASYGIRSGLPGSVVLTGFGSLAGMVMNTQARNKPDAPAVPGPDYYVMINFIGNIKYLLERESDGYLLKARQILRAPLYREKGWENNFAHYTIPDKELDSVILAKSHSEKPEINFWMCLILASVGANQL